MKRLTIPLLLLVVCGLRVGAQQISCQLGQINNVKFFQYSSALETATGSVSVSCTPSTTAFSIALGAGASGSTTNRTMTCLNNCTPSTLGYKLFSDGSYTTNWGDRVGDNTVAGPNLTNTYTVWAQIPANEYFFANGYGGNYRDSILVTVVCPTCAFISGNGQQLTVTLQQTAVGCGISATNLDFPNYTGREVDATTTIEVGCSSGTPYHVGLSAGMATGATVSNRSMTLNGGTALLNYKLLQGSYSGSNWGNTLHGKSDNTDTVFGIANGSKQQLTVYGVIPAGQSVPQGTYTDTITATITY